MGFTKLHQDILYSTVWSLPPATRCVWITMLAMANQHGEVAASIPGLANAARIKIEDVEEALREFLAPDPYSRTPDHEGRRIKQIEGGWLVLNYRKYRRLLSQEDQNEKHAKRQRQYRERKRARDSGAAESGDVTREGGDVTRDGGDVTRDDDDVTRDACDEKQKQKQKQIQTQSQPVMITDARARDSGEEAAQEISADEQLAALPSGPVSSGQLHLLDVMRRELATRLDGEVPPLGGGGQLLDGVQRAVDEVGWAEVVKVCLYTWEQAAQGAIVDVLARRMFVGDGFAARRAAMAEDAPKSFRDQDWSETTI